MTVSKMEAWMELEAPLRVPQMLLEMAQWATGQAARQGATPNVTMLVIIMVVTAGEAVVNALLEPLVSEREWQGSGKRDGLERAGMAKKWIRLSGELGQSPILDRNGSPLKAFLEVANIRHGLIHFKHGRNIERSTLPLSASYDYGHVSISGVGALGQQPTVYRESELSDALKPERASGYYDVLVRLVRPLLDLVKDDHVQTAKLLRDLFDNPEHIEKGKNAEE